MTLPVLPLNNSNLEQIALEICIKVNEILKGRMNNAGTFTLTENATSTVVSDNLYQSDMIPHWVPTTANAAGAMSNLYVSARANGSFTLTHSNTATTDRIFLYSRLG